MINDKAISEKVVHFEGWNSQILIVALKSIDGKMFIDVRKWIEKGDQNIASRKGITLELAHWIEAIKQINEVIGANMENHA